MSRKKRKNRGIVNGILLLLLLLVVTGVLLHRMSVKMPRKQVPILVNAIERTKSNYGGEVNRYAEVYKLPASYLMALIILESSGRKIIPPRFEPHVYERLKEVKEGKRVAFEHVMQHHLADASDEALKNLASSWGPYQLMGYKCLLLNIKVRDIRGKDAIYWGTRWIDLTYGNELRSGHFRNAFHIHNTGRKYPVAGKPFTHDPDYVNKGIWYMKQLDTSMTSVPM